MKVPYAQASSGGAARDEIVKILRRFGCESVGFMDDFEKQELILAFKYRNQPVQLKASARGWAALYLRENPHTTRHRTSKQQYEKNALEQGMVAINSILRDWVKGQVTAVECGVLSFGAVFMPYMLTSDGRALYERIDEINMLPAPSGNEQ